jgi:hypothetical protein
MRRQHAVRDIDKELQSVAAIRLAALRRVARAQERERSLPSPPPTHIADASRGERPRAHPMRSGWEFLLQVPA